MKFFLSQMSFYAVKVGRIPGVYTSWNDAEAQVRAYPGALHKKFNDLDSATAFVGSPSVPAQVPKLRIKPVVRIKKVALEPQRPIRILSVREQKYFNHPDHVCDILHVYTDGSTLGNGSKHATGGYGVFFGRMDIPYISQTLNVPKVTNNIAELTAIIDALKVLKHLKIPAAVIHYDSDYAAGVITGRKQAHKNLELVNEGKQLLRELKEQQQTITFEHVYSHTGGDDLHSIGNDIVDTLAKRETLP